MEPDAEDAPGEEPPGRGAEPREITALLRSAEGGDRESVDRLFTLLYRELRRIAHSRLRQAPAEQTLSTTALVHEGYLKLSQGAPWSAADRTHFFSLAARAMRLILIDRARARSRAQRGGGKRPVDLENVEIAASDERSDELLALDRALESLEKIKPVLAQVVEWRFFAGLSMEEIVEISGRSERTIRRQWQAARAFLHLHLTPTSSTS